METRVDKNTYATLTGLIEHFSPTGRERPAVEWLVARMQELGYERATTDPAGNAVGLLGEGPRQIVLLGHIDTVPGQIPVRVEEGNLYGRGSVDAKGPLAAFVDAAARVGPMPGWQVVVVGAVDEEGDSAGARYAVTQFHPDFAIIGEPSRWDRITLGYKGSAWAEVSIRQPLAHTAGQGASACEAAVDVWDAVRRWAQAFNRGRERAFDQVLPTLRGLASGDDGFEEWASLRIGVRLPLDLLHEDWYTVLKELASSAQVQPLGYPMPAYQAGKNNALVRAFLAGIRSSGGKPGFVLKTGSSDLNIVAPAWGCPAVVYGPGDSALDHTPDEHLSLEEYEKAVSVLKAVLENLIRGVASLSNE